MKYFGIGNSSVDEFYNVDSECLESKRFRTEDTNDVETLEGIRGRYELKKRQAGGSVGNTIKLLGALGEECFFTGKVGFDKDGDIFRQALKKRNVKFCCDNSNVKEGDETTIIACLITGTDRTFALKGELTQKIRREDMQKLLKGISEDEKDSDNREIIVIKDDRFIFDGYIYRDLECQKAIDETINIMKEKQGKVILTSLAPFCIDEFGENFRKMLDDKKIDILFTNNSECNCLFKLSDDETEGERSEFLKNFSKEKEMMIVKTNGNRAVKVYDKGMQCTQTVSQLDKREIIDATGAGDNFAGGFLYGLELGFGIERSIQLGDLFASEVIKQYGANLEKDKIKTIKKYSIFKELLRKTNGRGNCFTNGLH